MLERLIMNSPNSLRKFDTQSPVGIGYFDGQGRWIHMNPILMELLNYTDETYTQETVFSLFKSEEERSKCEITLCDLIQEVDQSFVQESVINTPDGTPLHLALTFSLISYNGLTSLYKVHVQHKNQTETHATSDLSSLHPTTNQLVAGIAHEVKNPLTAIKGFIQLINRTGHTEEYLNIIESEVERIEALLLDFMEISKPNDIRKNKIDLALLMKELVSLMEAQTANKNIELFVELGCSTLPTISGDASRLKQVFINLLKNAIEATKENGTIKILLTHDEHNLVVMIEDQGPGIPQKDLDKLGKPFFTTKESGTGLGIMVCQSILREHNGSLHFSSNENGTTVTVTLPM